MHRLGSDYPDLVAGIDALARGRPWCVTGASALIHDRNAFYFEITKPKHWWATPDGAPLAGLGCIGGSIEPGETILDCLHREAREELGADIRVMTASATQLVYEQRVIRSCAGRGVIAEPGPRPCLSTISANLYRQETLPRFELLAIMTYVAELLDVPTLGDLGGLIGVPFERMLDVLFAGSISMRRLSAMPGVEVRTNSTMPANLILTPVWTTRSLQLAWQAGRSPISELVFDSPRSDR